MSSAENEGGSVRPRVAIIGTRGYPSYYGGFETAVRKIAPYLIDSGWEVTVYGRKGATYDSDPDRDPRVRSITTRGFEKKSISTLSYGLTAVIHAAINRPDVVLIMNVANGFFLPLLKWRKIPTVLNVDGIEWHRAKWGRFAKWMFRTGAKLCARYADRLIFDSREIEKYWGRVFARDGSYIPYGGEVPEVLPLEPGLSHRGYVLLVARFVDENTVREFAEAAPEIARYLPVVIVGSSGYGGPLEAQIRELDRTDANIHWLGHISDDRRLLSLWQHTAVYFHGHSVGGTNPTLVQALAVGAPIVARDTPYNREVLESGGRFFSPNPESIAATVIQLARDPKAQELESRRNRERANRQYTWDVVCRDYNRELENQANSNSARS